MLDIIADVLRIALTTLQIVKELLKNERKK